MRIFDILENYFFLKEKPRLNSIYGDVYTDMFNDILIQRFNGLSDEEIYEYIMEFGCEAVKKIIEELENY